MTDFEDSNACSHLKDGDARYQFQTVYFKAQEDMQAARAEVICSYVDLHDNNRTVLFNQEAADSICTQIEERKDYDA
ncbi:uncharacterized protein L201_005186 [Kwoniella dendrophila CBS 6074]|uniref:Uncharacterized protein n=1 Tax=Kwoniella dendrophila CBS 6074 TaxID=1295534 RepID=A0AAX4K0H4_9TREE